MNARFPSATAAYWAVNDRFSDLSLSSPEEKPRDLISNLPDELLHNIISRLPIKSQLKTSLLSRRWRNIWSTNPVLRLSYQYLRGIVDSPHYDRHYLHQIVDGIVRQWQAPRIQELRLDLLSETHIDNNINYWIQFAASRFVQDLRISSEFLFSSRTPYSLPSGFLGCCPSLVSLSLGKCWPPVDLPLNLRGLRSLHLSGIGTIAGGRLEQLLSLCPLLELLNMVDIPMDGAVISSQSLKTLIVHDEIYSTGRLVIAAVPNLRTISMLLPRATLSLENEYPHLVEFSLHVDPVKQRYVSSCFYDDYEKSPEYWLSLVPRVSHVRILSVDLCMLKALVENYIIVSRAHSHVFRNVKELHLNGVWLTDNLLHALHFFLRQRPSIEKLCLQFTDGYRYPECIFSEDEYDGSCPFHEFMGQKHEMGPRRYEREPPSYEQLQCHTLACLRIVRVIGFMGTRNDMRLVRFLLENAINLESLYLIFGWTWPDDILTQLSWCPRASPKVRMTLGGDKHPTTDSSCDLEPVAGEYKKWGCICPTHSIDPERESECYSDDESDTIKLMRVVFKTSSPVTIKDRRKSRGHKYKRRSSRHDY